ncbi:ROK family protein [Mycolicibacterium peregrinum]|uniref:ROK family protein n=1 Tax=Mycolicibacterium peregrinum TaxID=43304 RepID=UPI000B2D02F4|nr:ROK family protein [Mycolicibacterium peregrinum]
MTSERSHVAPKDDASDEEFERLLEAAESDPAARMVYEDTMRRVEMLAAGQEIRKKRKLSQRQLADIMGTTQSAISDFESGRVEPQLRTMQRYARALGHRFEFAIVSPDVPVAKGGTTSALFNRLKELALSPLLTTLASQSERQGKTLQALANAILLPEAITRPILSMLNAEGWTTSVGEGDDRVYSIVEEASHVIGVSLERDRVVGVLVNMYPDVIKSVTLSLADTSPETVLETAADAVTYLYKHSDRRVLGVGVCLAGVVRSESGQVDFAPELQTDTAPWKKVQLEAALQDEVQDRVGTRDLLVAVENDANALAAYEYLRRGDGSVAVVLLSGTGIGTGFVLEGKLIHGAHSAAGEGGHTIVDPAGPPCRAKLPHSGCLETMASAKGILDGLGIPAETSSQISAGLATANDRVRNGDSATEDAFVTAGQALGRFLATTVMLLDPARAVIYADPHLAKEPSAIATAFRNGVQFGLEEAAASRLHIDGEPRLEWHPLDDNVRAIAAGAAAYWYFLKQPSHWAPSLRSGAPTSEPVWA